MNIILSGGGTAGHINPAIAIAEAVRKKYSDAKITFIGRNGGRENDLVKNAEIPIITLKVGGLSRRLSPKNFKIIRDALKAKAEAAKILESIKPDIVIGTGGYVCWPVIKSAQEHNIPTVLHESNSVLGLTSKLLYKKCDRLLLGTYPEKNKYKNSVFCGNPLKDSFRRIPKERAKKLLGIPPDKTLIVSIGGSIGAEKLNDAIITLMKNYSMNNRSVFHIHSCGHRYYNKLKDAEPTLFKERINCKIVPFIDDMATVLSAADIAISRCGAMTLSEIAYCGNAAILIPSPNVTGNHQLKNAISFCKETGARMIEEKHLTDKKLTDEVDKLVRNIEYREEISTETRARAVTQSRELILMELEKIVLG